MTRYSIACLYLVSEPIKWLMQLGGLKKTYSLMQGHQFALTTEAKKDQQGQVTHCDIIVELLSAHPHSKQNDHEP